MRKTNTGIAFAAALILFGGNVAFGCACQNKPGEASGSVFVFPAAVGWAASVDDALRSAKEKNKPIAVYFASKEEFPLIGESPETVQKIAADNNNTMPTTVFDLPKLLTHLREMSVVEFVKIAMTPENQALVSKYSGAAHTLVILAPNGERIDGGSVIGPAMPKLAASAKTKIDAWQSAQLAQSK